MKIERPTIELWFKEYSALSYTYTTKKINGEDKLVAGFNINHDGCKDQIEKFKESLKKEYGEPIIFEIDGVRLIQTLDNDTTEVSSDSIRPASSIRRIGSWGTVGGILDGNCGNSWNNPILLTCEHVLENSQQGDEIQVWLNDEAEIVARFCEGVNDDYFDFAIAEIEDEDVPRIEYRTAQGYCINFNEPTLPDSNAGQNVRFTDRNGNFSPIAQIISTDSTIRITDSDRLYFDQIVLHNRITFPGDSGAVPILLNANFRNDEDYNYLLLDAMGLVFAEGFIEQEYTDNISSFNGEHTFMNPIQGILERIREMNC